MILNLLSFFINYTDVWIYNLKSASKIPSEYVGWAKQTSFNLSTEILFCIAIITCWRSEEASADTIWAPIILPSCDKSFIKPSVSLSQWALPSAEIKSCDFEKVTALLN